MCQQGNKRGSMIDNRQSPRTVDSFQELLASLLPLSSWRSERDSDSPSISHWILQHVCVAGRGGAQDLDYLALHFVSYWSSDLSLSFSSNNGDKDSTFNKD